MSALLRFTIVAGAALGLAACGVNKGTHPKALDSLAACQAALGTTKTALGDERGKVPRRESELSGARTEKEKRIAALVASMSSAEEQLLKLKQQQEQAEARLASYRKLNERLRQLVDTGKLTVAFRNGQMILKLP